MSPTRLALILCSCAAFAAAVWVAASDQHYVDRNASKINCGNALIATDTTRFSLSTGNIDDDDFTQDDVVVQCDREIVAQRVYVVCILVVAVSSGVAASRTRKRALERVQIPGDPIV